MSNFNQTYDWRLSAPRNTPGSRTIQPQRLVQIEHLDINRCFDDAPVIGGPNSKWRLERKNDFGEFPYDLALLERISMVYCLAPVRNEIRIQTQANYLMYLRMYDLFRRAVLKAYERRQNNSIRVKL